ncbi:MAG: hypothetical protein E7526_06635, partial [Ruminococcaceae bacterium]|nr:hypothetical protein [Oscillospiraceae bacterium]
YDMETDIYTEYPMQEITYDTIGNPLSYRDGYTFTWTNGRYLATATKGTNSYSYAYDADGKRISKTVNGVTTKFHYDGDTLIGQNTANGTQYTDITFLRDATGTVYGLQQGSNLYYFAFNVQGDVIGIYAADGTVIATYDYDDWGVCTVNILAADSAGNAITSANHIANINPIRYRGYYYDAETNFYFLQTRYYDPVVRRFINADDPEILLEDNESVLQYNLYAYCWNNPINMSDHAGESPANIIGGIIGGVSGAALGYLLADTLGLKGWKKWALISAATVGGVALGAFLGPYVAKLGTSVAAKLGIKSIPKLGSQIGRLGKLVKNTRPAIRGLTRHGLQRMAQRGISQSMAKSIVRTGHAIAQSGGKTLFFTQAGVVVLNKAGEIVTAYSSRFFDAAMKEIVRQFYG